MNPNESPNPYDQQPGAQPQNGDAFVPSDMPGAPAPQPFAPQQPAAFGPPQSGVLPSQPPTPNAMPTMQGAGQPGRGRKGLVLGLLIVIIIAAVGAYFGLKKNNTATNGSSSGSAGTSASQLGAQLQTLTQKGSNLQATDLSKFDKTALFYAVLKNAAQQNVVTLTSDHFEGASGTDRTTRALENIHHTTFDYKTKALAAETQSTDGTFAERCVSGKNYTYDNVNTMSWQAETGSTASCTNPTTYDTTINDGMNSGGLTAAQAQTFVNAIAGTNGLITVDSMAYVTHANAPYIRLAVTVHPVKTSNGYQGMGSLLASFKETGLDPVSWPYESFGSLATGAKFIYYVNPATQLPAYSQIGLTYSLDDNGNQKSDGIYTFQDSEYAFGGAVQPLSLTGAPQQIKLSWPEESF